MQERNTILIVDDDELLRTLIRETLSLDGYQVFEAENGESIDPVLAKHQVDLIVLVNNSHC